MRGFILGSKQRQSQRFDASGTRVPATFVKTAPCYLIDVKVWPSDHRMAVKLGFGTTKNIKKPVQGQLQKAGIKTPLRFLKEIRLDGDAKKEEIVKIINVGNPITPSLLFKAGDRVNVSGISKGKGFQGVVRRHKFAGGYRTHGQSDRERAPGSIGQTTTPGRVYKGKRMAGRMGGARVTVQNLEVLEVRDDGLLLKGLVPGATGGLLEIKGISS